MVSFTTATMGAAARSVSARPRPRTMGIPTVSKYPVPTRLSGVSRPLRRSLGSTPSGKTVRKNPPSNRPEEASTTPFTAGRARTRSSTVCWKAAADQSDERERDLRHHQHVPEGEQPAVAAGPVGPILEVLGELRPRELEGG